MARFHSALDAVDLAPAPQSSEGRPVRASPVITTTASDAPPRPIGGRPSPFGVRLRRTSKKVGQTLFSDKMAVANVVMFIITAAIFLPAIAVLFVYLDDTGENQKTPTGGIHMRAQQALWQLTSSTGLTESGKTDWNNYGEPWNGATTNKLDEVGLVSDHGRALSYDKVRMLQQGRMLASEANGFLDYPELKSVLNMGDRFDLRIRSYPVVASSVGNAYGSEPIKGKHIGYVAAVTNSAIDANGDFANPTARATAEIAALQLLDLTTDPTSQTNGFDGDWYQPGNSDLPLPSYVLGKVEGDIIATTSREYHIADPLNAKPYLDHFFDSYFKLADDSYRFDALVFGSDVDLTLWNTDKARTALTGFLDSGRAIVFLGSSTSAEGLVNKCGATVDCLLRDEDAHAPFTTPDSTNPILNTPNKLDHESYDSSTAGGDWPLCDDDLNGFIPILMLSGSLSSPGCSDPQRIQKVMLGITAADRYENGGTLVLSAYDVTKSKTANKFEAARYYSNILNIALLRAAYIDFGPPLPDQAPVEHAERVLLLTMPNGTTIDLAIQVYAWRTG